MLRVQQVVMTPSPKRSAGRLKARVAVKISGDCVYQLRIDGSPLYPDVKREERRETIQYVSAMHQSIPRLRAASQAILPQSGLQVLTQIGLQDTIRFWLAGSTLDQLPLQAPRFVFNLSYNIPDKEMTLSVP